MSRIFFQGAFVQLLNPKTALFLFAFLPQFVDASRGSVARQVFLLGLVFVLLALCTDGTYGLLAGSLARWLRRNSRVLTAQRYFAGIVYVSLGVVTALSGMHAK